MDHELNINEENLRTPFPGKIWYVRETGSTMEIARNTADSGRAENGLVIRAGRQTDGRGRGEGRKWESNPEENLLITILISIMKVKIPISAFPLAAGLAVAMTVEGYGLNPEIKWPNDILCEEKKICGILCETVGDYLSAGIGLNCCQKIFPPDLRYPASSLALLTRRDFRPSEVLEDFLPNLHSVLSAGNWREEVEKRLYARDRAVAAAEGAADCGEETRVVIRGIGEMGELITEDSEGNARNIFSGEILYGRS